MNMQIHSNLHPDVCKGIDAWIEKFPKGKQKSALLMALRIVQDHYGFIHDEHIAWVADYLGISETEVSEVVTFYSLYKRQPEGKHCIKVCHSVSCFLSGSGALIKHLKRTLGVEVGQTTEDGRITLKETECLGACCSAPCVLINDNAYHGNMDAHKADQLVATLRQDDAKPEDGHG